MNNFKRQIITLIVALGSLGAFASEEADQLLDKVVEWTSAKKTVEVDYSLSATEDGSEAVTGTIIIDGKRFSVRSDMLDVWYNGTDQWSYSPSTGEVSLTTPTDEELQQVNPYVIIDAFRRNYTAGLKPLAKDSRHHVLLLTPNDPSSDITRVEVSVPIGYYYPARIVVWTASGETLNINTRRIIRGKRYADSDFNYSKSVHPDAEIIDLR